jgi:hypothetical protein
MCFLFTFSYVKAASFLFSDINQKKDIEEALILKGGTPVSCLSREKC